MLVKLPFDYTWTFFGEFNMVDLASNKSSYYEKLVQKFELILWDQVKSLFELKIFFFLFQLFEIIFG
jgi:hypothetical protein